MEKGDTLPNILILAIWQLWVVWITFRPIITGEIHPEPIQLDAGWVTEPVIDDLETANDLKPYIV